MKKLESSLLNMVLVLTAISLIAGGTLAYINKVTQGPIAEINAKNLQDGIKKVILGSQPGDLKVEEPVEANGYTLYKTDKGTAVKAVTNGFGGPLEILVGFNEDGNILGYTSLKEVCAGMYYGSYSLPTYVTVWNAEAFLETTVVPVILMMVVPMTADLTTVETDVWITDF